MRKEKWLDFLDKYALVKQLYQESEETDPELKTNLQPLNEFRAVLDHVCRLLQYEMDDSSGTDAAQFDEEYRKARSHICRAFFDVSDMLSINYRNKIIDFLSPFSWEVLRTVLPDYYPAFKPDIERISRRIGTYRNEKGQKDENELFEAYKTDVTVLRDIYIKILNTSPSLNELQNELQSRKRKHKAGFWSGWLFGLISLLLAFATSC